MKATPWTHTIQTRSHARLLQAATVALETARLTIVRGPAGIGKTYALDLIEGELSGGGAQVFRVLASADKSASVKKFFEKAIFDLGLMGHGGSDPVDRLAGYLLRSYPFRKNGPRVLLVIDECQHLTAKILETLRSIYDRGQRARDFDPDAPAFGMLFVGNPNFLTRGGKAERAAFEALLSRGPIEWELSRPPAQEYADLAAAFFPDAEDLQDVIRSYGESRRNLREMNEKFVLARHFAGGGQITMTHLQKAILLSSGAK